MTDSDELLRHMFIMTCFMHRYHLELLYCQCYDQTCFEYQMVFLEHILLKNLWLAVLEICRVDVSNNTTKFFNVLVIYTLFDNL